MMPFPTLALAKAYIDELRREAQRERLARQAKARNRKDKDHPAGWVEPVRPKPFRRWRVAEKTKRLWTWPLRRGSRAPQLRRPRIRPGTVSTPERQRTAQKR